MRTLFTAQVIQIIVGQIALTALLAGIAWTFSPVAATSALAGGLATAIPNLFFARRVFSPYDAQHPDKMLGRIYGAEISKLLTTGMLFFAAIVWLQPLNPAVLFLTYLVVHLFPAMLITFLGDKLKKTR